MVKFFQLRVSLKNLGGSDTKRSFAKWKVSIKTFEFYVVDKISLVVFAKFQINW